VYCKEVLAVVQILLSGSSKALENRTGNFRILHKNKGVTRMA